MILLTVNREGTFKVKPKQCTLAQCGANGKLEYGYRVSITATDRALIQPEQFVIDNAAVAEYFHRKYEVERSECPSCEVMVVDAIEHFRDVFKTKPYRKVELVKIRVMIRGASVSWIEGDWTNMKVCAV